jgi:uncharacterized membrane protein
VPGSRCVLDHSSTAAISSAQRPPHTIAIDTDQFVHTTAVNKLDGLREEQARAMPSARHLGHLDIVRELIDGAKGE